MQELSVFHERVPKVTSEIERVLGRIEEQQIVRLVQSILDARHIVLCGAGRVGLACSGFAMRLGHLGKTAFTVGDSTIPPVDKGDLLIVGSSSGETQTVYDVAALGKKKGTNVVVITASPSSRLGKLADSIIVLDAPTKFGGRKDEESMQPMATLFEQSLQVMFDIIVLILMEKTRQQSDDLWARHTNLD